MFMASIIFEANDNFSGDPFMGIPFRIFFRDIETFPKSIFIDNYADLLDK